MSLVSCEVVTNGVAGLLLFIGFGQRTEMIYFSLDAYLMASFLPSLRTDSRF